MYTHISQTTVQSVNSHTDITLVWKLSHLPPAPHIHNYEIMTRIWKAIMLCLGLSLLSNCSCRLNICVSFQKASKGKRDSTFVLCIPRYYTKQKRDPWVQAAKWWRWSCRRNNSGPPQTTCKPRASLPCIVWFCSPKLRDRIFPGLFKIKIPALQHTTPTEMCFFHIVQEALCFSVITVLFQFRLKAKVSLECVTTRVRSSDTAGNLCKCM